MREMNMTKKQFEAEMQYTREYVAATTGRPKVAYGEIENGKVVAAFSKNSSGEIKWR